MPRAAASIGATPPQAGVRTAISIGALEGADELALYFGDIDANVYAIDAATGAEFWTTEVDPHPVARVTGAPTLHDGRLYDTVSSIEEVAAANPAYACCTFRGSVLALDPATGDRLWKTFVIPDNAGQAGAAIWSSPTIDATRGLLYAATGNAYTQPAAATSDSVMAFDLESGAIRWTTQLTPDDAFIIGCQGSNPNCPEDAGPDHDFGSSPSLVTMSNGVRPPRGRPEVRRSLRTRPGARGRDRLAAPSGRGQRPGRNRVGLRRRWRQGLLRGVGRHHAGARRAVGRPAPHRRACVVRGCAGATLRRRGERTQTRLHDRLQPRPSLRRSRPSRA